MQHRNFKLLALNVPIKFAPFIVLTSGYGKAASWAGTDYRELVSGWRQCSTHLARIPVAMTQPQVRDDALWSLNNLQ
jgi:hypothetical protein